MLAILLITRSTLEEGGTVLLFDPINVNEIYVYIYICIRVPTQALINIYLHRVQTYFTMSASSLFGDLVTTLIPIFRGPFY